MGDVQRQKVTIDDKTIEVYYTETDDSITISSMWEMRQAKQVDCSKERVKQKLQ
jgi:hypothetical protein